jgi:hypothetical protein
VREKALEGKVSKENGPGLLLREKKNTGDMQRSGLIPLQEFSLPAPHHHHSKSDYVMRQIAGLVGSFYAAIQKARQQAALANSG